MTRFVRGADDASPPCALPLRRVEDVPAPVGLERVEIAIGMEQLMAVHDGVGSDKAVDRLAQERYAGFS